MTMLKTTSINNLMPIFIERLEKGQSIRFSPQGTSMLPMVRQNIDNVVISPINGKLSKYDIPLYQRKDGKYILHRIIEVGETYTCIGDNQYVKEYGIEHEQLIGYVTEFYRGSKKYSIDNVGYRIYCHIWNSSRQFRYFCFRVKRKLKRLIVG